MKLYGSIASPYVRRLRLLMEQVDYEFVLVDVYAPKDRAMLIEHNPTLKIPMLEDDGQVVLDSKVIYQYLVDKGEAKALSLAQQNILSAIDAATDSLVNLFLLSKSGIDTTADKLYFRLQHERLQAVFASLEESVESSEFSQWDFLSMSLFAMLDWVVYRELFDVPSYPKVASFHATHSGREICEQTDPRKA
jgi:glutathione S-transferase